MIGRGKRGVTNNPQSRYVFRTTLQSEEGGGQRHLLSVEPSIPVSEGFKTFTHSRGGSVTSRWLNSFRRTPGKSSSEASSSKISRRLNNKDLGALLILNSEDTKGDSLVSDHISFSEKSRRMPVSPPATTVTVPVQSIAEGIPKLHIEDYMAPQPGLQLSTISYDGQSEDETGGDLNDILDQLKQMDEYFSNVDVCHVGDKLLDREDLEFLCKASVACPHVPLFQKVFTNFQAVMPEPKQIAIARDIDQEDASLLAELLKEAAAQLSGDEDDDEVLSEGEEVYDQQEDTAGASGVTEIESAKTPQSVEKEETSAFDQPTVLPNPEMPENFSSHETPAQLQAKETLSMLDLGPAENKQADSQEFSLETPKAPASQEFGFVPEPQQQAKADIAASPEIGVVEGQIEGKEVGTDDFLLESSQAATVISANLVISAIDGTPTVVSKGEILPEQVHESHSTKSSASVPEVAIFAIAGVVSTPDPDVSESRITTSASTAVVSISQEALSKSEKITSKPEDAVSSLEEAISVPEEAVSKPEGAVSKPEDAVSSLEEVISVPEEAVSKPEEAVSNPEEAVSNPEETALKPEEAVSEQPMLAEECVSGEDPAPESARSTEGKIVVRIPVFGTETLSPMSSTAMNICGSVLGAVQSSYCLSSPRWSASLVGPDGFHHTCSQLPLEKNHDARALWLVSAQFRRPRPTTMPGAETRRLAVKMSVVLGGLVERGDDSPSAADRRIEESTQSAGAYARRHSAPALSPALQAWAATLYDVTPGPQKSPETFWRSLRSIGEIREWAENYEADRRWEWNRIRLRRTQSREYSPIASPLERVRLRQGERQARLGRDDYHEETERKFQLQLEAVRARMRRAAAKKGRVETVERQSRLPREIVYESKGSASRKSSLTGTKISAAKPTDQLTTPAVPPKRHQLPPRSTPNAPTVSTAPGEQTTDFRHVLRRTGRLEALRAGRVSVPPDKEEAAPVAGKAILVHKAIRPSDARDMFERKAREQARSGEAPSEWFLKQVSKYQKA
eukprot:Gregarina_sp_Poly_1__1504@NODE_1379_length_4262_cov_262_050536_g923_i0_p1_GENE_NODE_1379_length_4262_cov_262_050536_g923_i0NODE_1379_length_4262_cov_262_050536_g923_i0_p1_ORF_typecomplete_len1022_score199_58Herpes_BLLF1/PF05109_13/1_5e04Herpes_BLLF1/PF05109_13/4_6e03Herpes_BLLF1/PF05109_13/2_2e03Herpes_BLLF1/PF05109_13/0_003Herpes_BLLF1/PF05109_13/39_NODE_1379_length_4262_cov_262_050536_g923_i04303495